MARALKRLEIWDKLEANGGSPVHVVRDLEALKIKKTLDNIDTLVANFGRSSPAWDELVNERVFRFIDTDDVVSEWRIRKLNSERSRQGLRSSVEAEDILYDLMANSEIMERTEQNNEVTGIIPLFDLTPSEVVDFIMKYVPSYFNKGTIEPTDHIDVTFKWSTPLEGLRQVADKSGAEIERTRLANGTFDINLVNERGVSAEKASFFVGKNIIRLEHELDSKEQATRIYPIGGGPEVEPGTIKHNAWEVASVSGSTVDFVDAVVGFSDQLNGLYIEKVDGSLTEVTDSTSPNTITVTDATGITAGDELTFRRDSNGTELTYLEHPDADPNNPKVRKLERDDIGAIQNYVQDPYLQSGISWYDPVGAPTTTETTQDNLTDLGNKSLKVEGNTGEGIETDIIDIDPTESRPYFSAATRFYLEQGSVRLEIVDVTNGNQVYPDPEGEMTAFSNQIGWVKKLSVDAWKNFFEAGTTQVRVRLIADEDNTIFYADGFQLVRNAVSPDNFFKGRAANVLWKLANEELEKRATPVVKASVQAADLERLEPSEYPNDEIVLGGTVKVRDTDLDLDFDTRIIEVEESVLTEAKTSIKISNRPEDLTGLLGFKPPEVALATSSDLPATPPDIDPNTVKYTWEEAWADVTWNAVRNAERYEVRWDTVDGTITTAEEVNARWQELKDPDIVNVDDHFLGSVKTDEVHISKDRVVGTINARQMDIYILPISPNGTRAKNVTKTTIENPAPDASSVNPGVDVLSTVNDNTILIEADITNTEATKVWLRGGTTSGGSTKRIGSEELLPDDTTVAFTLPIPAHLAEDMETNEETSAESFWKLEFTDPLVAPLGESTSLTSQFSFISTMSSGGQPSYREDVSVNIPGNEVTFSIEFRDPELRLVPGSIQFKTRADVNNFGAFQSTWDTSTGTAGTDVFVDRSESISITNAEKHSPMLLWKAQWTDSNGTVHEIGGLLIGDINDIPDVAIVNVEFDADGVPTVTAKGDADTTNIHITADGSAPTTGDPGVGGRNGSVTFGSTFVDRGEEVTFKARGTNTDGVLAGVTFEYTTSRLGGDAIPSEVPTVDLHFASTGSDQDRQTYNITVDLGPDGVGPIEFAWRVQGGERVSDRTYDHTGDGNIDWIPISGPYPNTKNAFPNDSTDIEPHGILRSTTGAALFQVMARDTGIGDPGSHPRTDPPATIQVPSSQTEAGTGGGVRIVTSDPGDGTASDLPGNTIVALI